MVDEGPQDHSDDDRREAAQRELLEARRRKLAERLLSRGLIKEEGRVAKDPVDNNPASA